MNEEKQKVDMIGTKAFFGFVSIVSGDTGPHGVDNRTSNQAGGDQTGMNLRVAQGRPGEDRPGAAFAAGNDDAGQMDLRAAGDGIVEIRQPEAL